MTEKLKHTLYTPTDCIPEQTMFDYIDNKLSPKEQHLVEKHLLECELCSDAMDGLRLVKDRSIIRTIDQQVSEKIAAPLVVKRSGGVNYKIIMSVAAGLLLLMGGVFFFNHLSPSAQEKATVADLKVQQKEVQNEPAPAADTQAVTSTPPVTTKTETNGVSVKNDQAPAPVLEPALEEEAKQEKPAQETAPDDLKKAKDEEKTITTGGTTLFTTTGSATLKWTDSTSVAGNNAAGNAYTYEWTAPAAGKDDNATGAGLIAPQKEDTKNQAATYTIVTEQLRDETKANKAKKAPEEKKAESHAENFKTAPSATQTPAYAPPDLAQNMDNTTKADSVYTVESARKNTAGKIQAVDQLPEFPGGNAAMIKFLSSNAKWPPLETDKGITSAKVYVQFTIDKNGDVKNPKILKGINPEYDKEALRIVNLMPKWKPAISGGKPVDYLYNLPILLDPK